MVDFSADALWNATPRQLEKALNSAAQSAQPHKIYFYVPSFAPYKVADVCGSSARFSTVSVTGNGCALNCMHCGGKVLQTMHAAQTPQKLIEVCSNLKQQGAVGVLVSGGCLPDGTVPIEPFAEALGAVKDLGLTVFVHTGIIKPETARQLKKAQVDAALIDVIGSNRTIREIYNLPVTVQDYENSLKALNDCGVPFVPHVIVGLQNGKLEGELEALKLIKQFQPAAVVLIAFMPIHGTAMQDTAPPSPIDVAKVTAIARVMFAQTPLVLGCMRPKGKHRSQTDVWALKAGVDGVAFPSQEAIAYAKARGDEVIFSPFCCAQIYRDGKAKA
jgi:uncharacterized radical SAM superfamily protein